MPDSKQGREEGASREGAGQRTGRIEGVQARGTDLEPPRESADTDRSLRRCHRRNCSEPAVFRVVERYLEETGHGPVEAQALLCREHTEEEGPTNLDNAYEGYVFLVEPLPGVTFTDRS